MLSECNLVFQSTKIMRIGLYTLMPRSQKCRVWACD